jgi:hypothetical protein
MSNRRKNQQTQLTGCDFSLTPGFSPVSFETQSIQLFQQLTFSPSN